MPPNENKMSYRRSVACAVPVGGKAAVVGSTAHDTRSRLDAMKGCKAWAKRAHAVYEKQTNPS